MTVDVHDDGARPARPESGAETGGHGLTGNGLSGHGQPGTGWPGCGNGLPSTAAR